MERLILIIVLAIALSGCSRLQGGYAVATGMVETVTEPPPDIIPFGIGDTVVFKTAWYATFGH